MSPQADVVVPVFADAAVTEACLRSVLACSGGSLGRLIVVNDASPDPRMGPMLGRLRDESGLVLLSNERNVGFVASANRGLAASERDVVLLNSDTQVTPGWLAELIAVGGSSDDVAAVAPLSNNATLCSVPELGRGADASLLRRADLQLSGLPRATEMPTGVGFCLWLKREVLRLVGAFDPAYGRGYNEENDWCMRARSRGFRVLRANHALVYHLGSISFGPEREALERANVRRLYRRYPHYLQVNQQFERGPHAQVAANHVRGRVRGLTACLQLPPDDGLDDQTQALMAALAEHSRFDVSVRTTGFRQIRRARRLGLSPADARHGLQGFQLVHHASPPRTAASLRALLDAPCPVVLSVGHEVWERFSAEERWLARTALLAAQAVVVSSEHARRRLLASGEVEPERVHVVRPVFGAAWARGDEAAAKAALERHALPERYFVHVSEGAPRRNLELLVESYALYRASGGTSALILATSHPLAWPEAMPGLFKLELQDPTELGLLMRGANAFVDASTEEDAGLFVGRALHLGLPVVALRSGALPELAKEAALFADTFAPQSLASALRQVEERRPEWKGRAEARSAELPARDAVRALDAVYLAASAQPDPRSLSRRETLAETLRAMHGPG